MTALVRVFTGRPVWADAHGWRVCVAVHDGWHLSERRRLIRRLRDTHHDGPRVRPAWDLRRRGRGEWRGCRALWRETRAQLVAFETREREWYARLGLTMPGDKGGSQAHVVELQ